MTPTEQAIWLLLEKAKPRKVIPPKVFTSPIRETNNNQLIINKLKTKTKLKNYGDNHIYLQNKG